MRKALIVLLMLIVISPDPSGVPGASPVQSCECAPSACHCKGHDHSSGHEPLCEFTNGGKCGVQSADLSLAALTGRFQYVVHEAPEFPGLISTRLDSAPRTPDRLSGHPNPPKHPPRFSV